LPEAIGQARRDLAPGEILAALTTLALPAVEAFVVENPGIGILNDRSHHAEAGAMFRAFVADDRLNAFPQTQPAVVNAIVSSVGIQAADAGAGDQGQTQQFGKHLGIIDVSRGSDRPYRPALG
jgi:hypothetical protein